MTKQTLSFDLYRTPSYSRDDNSPPPTSAAQFIVWLQALIALVPDEHRASVQIEFDDDGDYDRPRPELSVYWTRLESDEEYAARTQREAAQTARRDQQRIAEELATLDRLQRKYSKPDAQ
jgi:hypothetical protein